jgi:general secretion pathway protein A
VAIYEKYYRCQREPFSLSPDPEFFYNSSAHREALAALHYLVQQRKGLAVVTGEVGTGKTLLLRSLIEAVAPEVHTCFIFDPPRSSYELYEMIADELDISLSVVGNPVLTLNRHLLSLYENGDTVILIFDEAQALSVAVLEEIRLLTNLETSSAKLVQVVMAGQPEFDVTLDTVELRALRQRLIFRIALKPLEAEDTERYIAARLITAGAPQSTFTGKACDAIHRYSRGIPRLVNVICDNAMLAGYALENPTIEDSLINEVAADLALVDESSSSAHLVGSRESKLTSRRRLHIAFAVFWLFFAIGVAAVAALAGQTAASSSSLNQLQDWLAIALQWLGRSG